MRAAQLLVIDDDALITATLAATLRQAGYQVAEATSPHEALTLCASTAFELAIVDQRMPGMTGTDLARALRDTYSIPVVFLSAYNDPDVVTAATEVGALGYFLKPVDPASILPSLQNMLARAQELRDLRAREAQLRTALANEREINTAVGILMERMHLARDEAFEALRSYARSQRQQVVKIAGELLQSHGAAHRLLASIATHWHAGRRTDPRGHSRTKSDDSSGK